MDGRRNNGGARAGAGRKPKAEEENIKKSIEDAIGKEGIKQIWIDLAANAKKDTAAANIILNYYYGKPKEKKSIEFNDGVPLKIEIID